MKCTYDAKGPAVLRIPNIRNREFDFTDLKFATKPKEITDEDFVAPGDFLLIRTNGSIDLIGRAGIAKSALATKCSFASYLIRFRLVGEKTLWSWISLAWDSHEIRSAIQSRAATTAGQYNVSLSGLADLALPLPPLPEQSEIIPEVERHLSAADRLAATLNRQLERARALRQSLLREAFAGNLVPQSHDDEPALDLLKRIQSARKVEALQPKTKRMPKQKKQPKRTARYDLVEVLKANGTPMTPSQLFTRAGYAQPIDPAETNDPTKAVEAFFAEVARLTRCSRTRDAPPSSCPITSSSKPARARKSDGPSARRVRRLPAAQIASQSRVQDQRRGFPILAPTE
jgi:type I restriction enzyme S subunit